MHLVKMELFLHTSHIDYSVSKSGCDKWVSITGREPLPWYASNDVAGICHLCTPPSPTTVLLLLILQKLLKQQKSHHKHDETRKQSVENNRRRSVLEELMGYDPMSPVSQCCAHMKCILAASRACLVVYVLKPLQVQ